MERVMRFRDLWLCGVLGAVTITSAAMPVRPVQSQKAADAVDLSYIDSSFAAGALVRPQQAMTSKFGKAVIENAFNGTEFEDVTKEFSTNFGVDLNDVKQLAVLVRERTLAKSFGMRLPAEGEPGAEVVNEVQLKNQMRQIALSFHNYADANQEFPPATRKLSWRVHILPYLEQQALYEQFDLDEDWDSEANKPLIEKMPDIFKSPRVNAAGKTSIHVFVGENAPFEDSLSFRDITDGTSNTIMAVIAGADKAAEWTKPGGLKIDEETPTDSFGDLDQPALVAMLDGSVSRLDGADEETVKSLLTHAGGEVINWNRFGSQNAEPDPEANPTIIAHCTKPIDQKTAVAMFGQGFGDPKKKKGNGQEYWDVDGYAIWFPNETTLVATQSKLLPRLMSNRKQDSKLRKLFAKQGSADVLLLSDTESMPLVFKQMIEGTPMPLATVTEAWAAIDVSSKKHPLLHAQLEVGDAKPAGVIQAVLSGSLAMGQQMMTPENAPPGMEGMMETLGGLIKGVKVERDEGTLTYTVRKPADYEKQIASLKPEFKKLGDAIRGARGAATRARKRNSMREIGLAFHNHHDVYNTFGSANGKTKADGGRKGGLSWRVHLLPFLEEVQLYEKFKLNEPWDSEHNKKLIAEMPDIFKVEGVNGEGKTSIHVLIGENAPFGDGKTPLRIREILDGTSNTILAVVAGSDKAETWTKPGGLELNEENPLKTLGKIGETFIALLADGSVRNVSKTIDGQTLKALSTHKSGEVTGF